MGKIKTFLRRYYILSKRLLKKPAFIIILALVPLLVLATTIISEEGDSGVLTVALAVEDKNDEISNEIVNSFINSDSIIRFKLCKSPKTAKEMVKSGEADSAWIFKDRLEERIRDFVNLSHPSNAFVTIIQNEETVMLRLAHEKLNTALYPYIAKAVYRQSVGNSSADVSHLSKEELDRYYDTMEVEGEDLFDFVYADNALIPDGNDDSNFIVSPMRGLLAIMILLAGIAVSMFYMNDEARGAFDRLPRGTGFSFSVIYHTTAVAMVGLVAYATLAITGIAQNWYELPILIIYCISIVGFSMCLRLLLRNVRLFGAIAPLLTVVTAVLCPIFISGINVPLIQILLPTFHYMHIFTNRAFILYMAIYSAILFALAFLLHSLKLKQKK